MAKIMAALKRLPTKDVLVGVPEEESDRREDGQGQPMTNAALAYIHNNGAPEAHIPPRPFMEPGIAEAEEKIAGYFKKAAQQVDQGKADRYYEAAGMAAQNAIRKTIQEGAFEPLAASTLSARARREGKGLGIAIAKGAKEELEARSQGKAPSTKNAKPLIDTAQMLKSITYVIRSGKPSGVVVAKKEMQDA